MKILDLINSPWAIMPSSLEQIHAIYAAKVAGQETEWLAKARSDGLEPAFERAPYSVEDGVAVVSIQGPIAQRANMFTRISGATSTDQFVADVQAAVDDPTVDAILLAVDSPGGSAIGLERAASIVRAAREAKPMAAWTDGLMASAAYWLGSAAGQVYIDANDTVVGSIGVITKHVDVSAAEEKAGIKVTEIYAGKYKRIASEHAPLTKEGRASIQDQVDHYYETFVDSVAANRGVPVETVLADMADGKVFIGKQAVTAGLADGVASRAEAISKLRAQADGRRKQTTRSKFMELTPDKVKAEAPDVANALIAEGRVAGMEEGVKAERARIAAIDDAMPKGCEALASQMKADGTDEVAAMRAFLKAGKEASAKAALEREEEAPAPVKTTAQSPKEDKPEPTSQNVIGQSVEMARKAAAYRAEMKAKGQTVSAADAVLHVMKEGV